MSNVTREIGEQGDDLVGIGTGVHADLKGGDGEVPREVGDGGDLAVGDDVEGAVAVAQSCAAERKVFDGALETGDGNDFAYVVLVLDEDEDAVQHVLEDGLSAETDAYAEDTGGGKERLVGYVEDIQDLQKGDETEDAVGCGANDRSHGTELGGSVEVTYLAVGAFLEAFDGEHDQALKDEDDNEDDEDRRQLVLEEDDKFVAPTVADNAQHTFVLRGRGQKEYDYSISLSLWTSNTMERCKVGCN